MGLSQLPPGHRRGVHAALRLMDERLAEVSRWIAEGGRTSGTLELVDDLDPAFKAEIQARVAALRGAVEEAARNLGLPPERMALSRRCQGTLGLTWELAPDLRPERMTGYGKVPEHLAPELQRLAEELEKPLLDLLQRFTSGMA